MLRQAQHERVIGQDSPPVTLSLSKGDRIVSSGLREQLAQHVRQNTTVAVVLDFYRGIDPQCHWDFLGPTIGPVDHKGNILTRLRIISQTNQVEHFTAVKLERLSAHAFLELAG